MRQYFSVLMIAARSTIYKILALLLLMTAVETALFWRLLRRAPTGELYSLQELFRVSGIPFVSGAAFLLLCAILCMVGYEVSGSRTRYTIQRLSVSEERATLLMGAYNMVCLFVFWAVQLLAVLLLCRLYMGHMDPMYYNDQSIFIAFYNNSFLHSLLPLDETSRYIRNAIIFFTLGISLACLSLKQRRGQKGVGAIAFFTVTATLTFPQRTGGFFSDLLIMVSASAVTLYYLYYIFKGQRYED